MKDVFNFEDLEVFQKAYRVSLDIHRASLKLPDAEQSSLAESLRRSSKQVCTHIAEGHGKKSHSPQDYGRYLSQAMGFCDEVRVWTRYCLDLGYIDLTLWQEWRDAYKQVISLLVSALRDIAPSSRSSFSTPRPSRDTSRGDDRREDTREERRPRPFEERGPRENRGENREERPSEKRSYGPKREFHSDQRSEGRSERRPFNGPKREFRPNERGSERRFEGSPRGKSPRF